MTFNFYVKLAKIYFSRFYIYSKPQIKEKPEMMQNSLFIKKSFFCDSKKQHIQKYYDFQNQLGKGTYGVVYKAKMKNKQNTYRAIKKVSKNNIRNLNQFITQIQILKQLDHPNIIKLYQTYENDSFLYLVTDLFEGGQLFQRLDSKGQFNENEARQIFIQILQAVNYCHLQKVCHRDLKPQNLLFLDKKSLNLKLIDFGLAFKWNKNIKNQLRTKRQNAVVGTPYYIAPQILRTDYDQRCDIWSLGVILYILVTADPPFNGVNDQQIMQKIKNFQYSLNCQETQNISPQLKDLIARILVPADKRISLQGIFQHPWIGKKVIHKKPLKLNFKKLHKYTKFSKIKTITVTYIASQMSQKQIHKLGQLFRQIDVNHDGFLSIEQIQSALKKQKQKVKVDELQQLLHFIDTDKNGKINYTEFISSCLQNSIVYKQQNLLSVFRMLDRDNNGSISSKQLKLVLKGTFIDKKEQKFQFNHKAVEQIMKKCDKNKDGKIDYNQFLDSISDL